MLSYLIGFTLLLGLYLGVGCAVAATSNRLTGEGRQFPKTALSVVALAVLEAIRWPLTIIGR